MKMNNKDAASQYVDLVNQPGLMDNMGDAFIEQGRNPALNGNQKMQNAMMSGFGHGMKGGANSARQEKLAWLEDQNKQIAMLDASLKTSLGKTALRQADLTNIGADYLIDIKKISNMYGTGDYVGLNELTPLVYNDIAEKYPDLTKKYGKLHHVYGNNMFFEKGKDVKGYNIKDVFEPIIDTLPEEQRRELAPLMSLTARNKFEQSDLMQNLTIDKERANIDNIRSQTNYHNAQADKTDYEMNNPPMSPAQTKTKEINEGRFATRHDNTEEKRILNNAYSQYIDNILDAQEKGLTGKSKPAEWKRYWAEVTGQSENMDIEEMLRITHANRVKELGGSNANIKQFEVAMDSAPSIKKDPDATIKFLDEIIAKNNEFIEETDYLGQTWEQNQYQGQERAILNDFRSRNKPTNNNNVDKNQGINDKELGIKWQ